MTFLIIIGVVFVIWFIVANVNSINEGKRQMRESARLNYIKEKFPEAYNEYCTWDARQRYGRSRIPEVIGWDDKTWELQNAMLLVKKNQKIRSEKEEKWSKEQFDFAEKCVAIAKKTMPGFGFYKYYPKVSTITKEGKPTNMNMLVWQHFADGLCLSEDLDYTNVQYIKNNFINLPCFKNKTRYFTQGVYEKIIAFIKELRKDDNVLVYLNYNIEGWDSDALSYHYNKIIEGLGNANIITSPSPLPISLPHGEKSIYLNDKPERKIVIFDMMTENSDLNFNCVRIFEDNRDKQPLICYISLLKCYDRQEMVDIIKQANEVAEKKAAEERAKEEERKKREAEELAEKKRKEEERARLQSTAKSVLVNNVKDWECLFGDFYYTWLFYYYPTTCDFEASESEWDDRYTVWDFKNDPEKGIDPEDHEATLDEVIPQIKEKLSETFGEEYLQFLTLVCLPASTNAKNAARYEEFSDRLCEETGMDNAYEHVHIVQDGMSKKDPRNTTGRSIQPVIKYDDNYFRGRYVLLFDDVVTKGGTMLRYKDAMEREGATVIGGMCLGKTKHERPERQRYVHVEESPHIFGNDTELPF